MAGTVTLTKRRLIAGTWHGVISAKDMGNYEPNLSVTHLETPLKDVNVRPTDKQGEWNVDIPVPASMLADGVQTVVIRDKTLGETLYSFTIVTGEPLEDDIRGEITLLREELDMLKRAFRRHCLETGAN